MAWSCRSPVIPEVSFVSLLKMANRWSLKLTVTKSKVEKIPHSTHILNRIRVLQIGFEDMRKNLMKHANADNNDDKALKHARAKKMIKLCTKAKNCMNKSKPYQKTIEAKA